VDILSIFSCGAKFEDGKGDVAGEYARHPVHVVPNDGRAGVQNVVIFHFCPICGSNVYYDLAVAPDFIGVRVGAFTDPMFPPPLISGFEEYRSPWAMNVAALPMPGGHHD
jgi:hypothetical protein